MRQTLSHACVDGRLLVTVWQTKKLGDYLSPKSLDKAVIEVWG